MLFFLMILTAPRPPSPPRNMTNVGNSPAVFHGQAGSLVTLTNQNRTAHRNHPTQEFNNGVVLSAEVLKDNQLFEVRIDKKVILFRSILAYLQVWKSLSHFHDPEVALLPSLEILHCHYAN